MDQHKIVTTDNYDIKDIRTVPNHLKRMFNNELVVLIDNGIPAHLADGG